MHIQEPNKLGNIRIMVACATLSAWLYKNHILMELYVYIYFRMVN